MRRLITASLAFFSIVANASEFSLKGTIWEKVSITSACRPSPLLLYSIALVEARTGAGNGMQRPHAYALRNAPSGSAYPKSYNEAVSLLHRYIAEDKLTDVGVMQINLYWNGSRVNKPEELLVPERNIQVGAEILCEAIAINRSDMELAIGGYHTRSSRREDDARNYARNVLSIWRNLQRLERKGG